MWNIARFLAVLLALCVGAESKKVLLVTCQITSHFFEMTSMSSGLVANGHEVYVIISRGYPTPDKVIKHGVKPLYFDEVPDALSYGEIMARQNEASLYEFAYDLSRTALGDCQAMVQDQKLNQDIKRIGFDLAIVDGFVLSFCNCLLPRVHGIPFVFAFGAVHPWVARVPALPSFSPLTQGASFLSDKMTFLERLQNLFYYVMISSYFPIPGRQNVALLHEYAPDVPSWEALALKSVLFIETRNFVLEKPSPSMPNFIQTPGITVSPPKPLPDDLEAIMAGADKGVVLVSFGSIASNFPDHITDKLIDAFNQLQETVIWKFSGKSLDKMKSRVNKNVHLLPWLPQNDLLGHAKTKVFVTHCGNNGQHEAVYHAVPMVGVPIFAEQFHNAFRQMDKGYGLSIIPGGLDDFTVDQLVAAIEEVASNQKYKNAITKASDILKDSPMDPIETTTYWLEHVMKFGGSHLRSYGMDMPWYQYFMIDIIVFFAVILHVVGYISFLVVRKIASLLSAKEKAKVA